MAAIFSALMDGFTGGGLLVRIRRPDAPPQVFADEESTQPQAELVASLWQRQIEQAVQRNNEIAAQRPESLQLLLHANRLLRRAMFLKRKRR